MRNLGFQQSKLDPCLYCLFDASKQLSGVVGVAVDDMVYGGNAYFHEKFDRIRSRFPFGKNREKSGRFCGRDLHQHDDGSITLDQKYYVDELQPIKIDRKRRLELDAPLNRAEMTKLREVAGALNWLQTISRPDLSGASSLLQGSFPVPRLVL